MKQAVAYEDAVDLLDADHKAVKKMFIDYNALCEDEAPGAARRTLAQRICGELTAHAQLEEELFYPKLREAIGDDALIDEALGEHAQAKEAIARIEGLGAASKDLDAAVKALGKLVDAHVLEERERIFLRARQSPIDLRGLAVPLFKRRTQLRGAAAAAAKEST